MNIQQLRYARALCDERSFVGAAAKCSVTQPTLSNAIAQLEAELGCRLFDRNTRSVRLTKLGEQIMPSIREVVNAYEKLQHEAKYLAQNQKNEIRIGISPLIGIGYVARRLARFSKAHPDSPLIYREENLAELCRLLKSRKLDIVVAPLDAPLSNLDDCIFHLLDSEPLVFIPSGKTAGNWQDVNSVQIDELAGLEFVLVPDSCGLTRVTKAVFSRQAVPLKTYPGEASSYRVVEEWARLGLGAGILPVSKVSQKKDDPCKQIEIIHDGSPVTIDYYAFGKPYTISPDLFNQVWGVLTRQ